MFRLSQRQMDILKAVVEEYIESASPVGSEPLERKYGLGVSPATIRNEMALLGQHGYLKQPHTSAGRVPTAITLRLYTNELMQEAQLSVAEEVTTKERLWENRQDPGKLLHATARSLADQISCVALVALHSGSVYTSGYANLLSMPEFYDIEVTRQVLMLIDHNVGSLLQLFEQTNDRGTIHMVFGEELNYPLLEPVGMVYSHFNMGAHTTGTVAAIGPARLNFAYTIPRVRYHALLLEELARGW